MKKIKLTDQQKKQLIMKVRATIETELYGAPNTENPNLDDDVFNLQYGLFVTLTLKGNLRGCIGLVEGVKPISTAIVEMAKSAAFHDPRFYPLKAEEYKDIDVEISILYPLERVHDLNSIEIGRDGLVIEKGYHRGLLLPQVAGEHNWDRERFLNETCRKAGLEGYCWENGATVYKFEAEVFNEESL